MKEFWQCSYVQLYRVEALVLLLAVVLGSMLILGSLRQRTSRSGIKRYLQAAFYLSGHAVSYVLGSLNDIPLDYWLGPAWAIFLIVLQGSAYHSASGSLEENEALNERFLWDYTISSLWFLTLLFFSVVQLSLWPALLIIWVLLIIKLRERKLALMSACRSNVGLYRVVRVIAEFMKSQQILTHEADPNTMLGYKYLVGVKEALDQVASEYPPRYDQHLDLSKIVTVEEIWRCKEGKLLGVTGDPQGKLKDICLSFALFWLLLRRFANYELGELSSEDSREKTWRFVREGLIKNQVNKEACERTFRVIEVELDFVYDYFYNNYYAAYSRGGGRILLVRLLVVFSYVFLSFYSLKKLHPEYMKSNSKYDPDSVKIYVTKAVVLVLTAVEMAQICIIATSKWVKVKWVCKYVQNRWWETRQGKCEEFFLCILCHTPFFGRWCKSWQRRLRQYSLLDLYGYTPMILRFKCILEGFVGLPTIGQKESKPTALSMEVKMAVLDSLLMTDGQRPTKGTASLARNGVGDKLSWACDRKKPSTHVILIWHIATSICELDSPTDKDASFNIATSLSKYCAYLVALAPSLLPDHLFITQCLFEKAVYEARVLLKDCHTMNSKRDTLRGHAKEDGTILEMGAFLGKQLMEIRDPGSRWMVLADFWAEMILFLASNSKDASAHAERLTSGGEFITHLWTLVTHAGIIHSDGECSVSC